MSRVGCSCLEEVSKISNEKNTRIVFTIPFKKGTCSRAVLRTEAIERGRGSPKPIAIVCTYCPFCGQEYPS